MVFRQSTCRSAAACLAALSAASCLAGKVEVTLLGDDSYPPYSYADHGRASGIYADILRAASANMPGYTLRLESIPWKRGMSQIEDGQALGLFPPYYRPERLFMSPYSVPMLEERVAVFCREKVFTGNPRLRWPDDYRGLTFGNNNGFSLGGPSYATAVQTGLIHMEEAPGTRTNLSKLIHGHLDCYLNDRIAVLSELSAMRREGAYNEGRDEKVVEGPTVSIENGYVGLTARDAGRYAYKDDFVSQLNAALVNLRNSGEIKRIVDRYLH